VSHSWLEHALFLTPPPSLGSSDAGSWTPYEEEGGDDDVPDTPESLPPYPSNGQPIDSILIRSSLVVAPIPRDPCFSPGLFNAMLTFRLQAPVPPLSSCGLHPAPIPPTSPRAALLRWRAGCPRRSPPPRCGPKKSPWTWRCSPRR